MAGVANVGSDRDWTGSIFNQANWYVLGRLAWDPDASSRDIAEDWVRMTFGNSPQLVGPVVQMMMGSREAAVDYMTPMGLHHIMALDTHFGPGPWVDSAKRADWDSTYYHHADAQGLGFDRTAAGSNAVSQYAPQAAAAFASLAPDSEKTLLWFHHLSWDWRTASGRTLWDELVVRYTRGVEEVAAMRALWARMRPFVDPQRYEETASLLAIQQKEAQWWRDACIAYFQSFSHRPPPAGYAPPPHPLAYYKSRLQPPVPDDEPQ
jgi:alpha-glucuronidase